MMEAFLAYIKTITALTLFSVMAGLMMPEGNFRKYLQMVLGVMILSALVQPLFQLGEEFPLSFSLQQETALEIPTAAEYENFQEKWVQEAYEAQLETAILEDLQAKDETVEWVRVQWEKDGSSDTYGSLESLEIGGKKLSEKLGEYAADRYGLEKDAVSVLSEEEGERNE